jgi:hypothetical protein
MRGKRIGDGAILNDCNGGLSCCFWGIYSIGIFSFFTSLNVVLPYIFGSVEIY